jgi:hypothetical protein
MESVALLDGVSFRQDSLASIIVLLALARCSLGCLSDVTLFLHLFASGLPLNKHGLQVFILARFLHQGIPHQTLLIKAFFNMAHICCAGTMWPQPSALCASLRVKISS